MKQVVRKQTHKPAKKKKTKRNLSSDDRIPRLSRPTKEKRNHPEFGTSKLEQDFARDFLDRLGVKYIWQFEAIEIKRFFDYYCYEENLIIEVNGSYWHGDSRIYEEKDLNRTQKRRQKVDEYKYNWAALHGIPILYIWEKDIRENPSMVMSVLKSKLKLQGEKTLINKEKKKRHVNTIDRILKEKKE